MFSRRQEIVNYYLQQNIPQVVPIQIKEAAAAAATSRYLFRGNRLSAGVVVRIDLNEYSGWVQSRTISDRVELLDDFFTKVVGYLDKYHGIYFRDEGDCIVSLFSSYFENLRDSPYRCARQFCESVVSGCYGIDGLTAKAIVAAGKIAIYQKSHEVDTQDWSAEGEPFVSAARLEQAVNSTQSIYYFADACNDYIYYFADEIDCISGRINRAGYRAWLKEKHISRDRN